MLRENSISSDPNLMRNGKVLDIRSTELRSAVCMLIEDLLQLLIKHLATSFE